VDENEWGDLECLKKPAIQVQLMEAYSQTLAIRMM
jgi:hypothetical protein